MAERRPTFIGIENLIGGSVDRTPMGISPERRAETLLNSIGLVEFTPQQLEAAHGRLRDAIVHGVKDVGDPSEGIPAVASKIAPITHEQFSSVPDGESTLTLAMGGTNPIVALWGKEGDSLKKVRSWQCDYISKKDRELDDEDFGRLAAQKVAESVPQMNLREVGRSITQIKSVGISLGFPAIAWEDPELGLNAQAYQSVNSNWRFTGQERAPFGKSFLDALHEEGFDHVEKVYFLPDPLALANDEPGAKMSLQAGTGTNMSAVIDGKHVDMQISSAKDIFREEASNPVFREMQDLELVPYGNALKQYTGGPRIKNRVIASMSILEKRQAVSQGTTAKVASALTHPGRDGILSDFASNFEGAFASDDINEGVKYALEVYDLDLLAGEYAILKEASRRALRQAGQVIGLMTAATVQEVGVREGRDNDDPEGLVAIPVDGGVIDKAYGVRKAALETIDTLLPDNNIAFLNRSDARGLAKFGVTLTSGAIERHSMHQDEHALAHEGDIFWAYGHA